MRPDARKPVVAPPPMPESESAEDTEFPFPGLAFRLRRGLVIVFQVALVTLSYTLAWGLRFDGPIPDRYARAFWITLAPLLVLRLAAFAFYRLYSGWWRYVGVRDMVGLVKAVLASSILFTSCLVFLQLAPDFPRSVL